MIRNQGKEGRVALLGLLAVLTAASALAMFSGARAYAVPGAFPGLGPYPPGIKVVCDSDTGDARLASGRPQTLSEACYVHGQAPL